MNVILDTPLLRTKGVTNPKNKEPKTSSILLISVAITMEILFVMYAGLLYTDGMMKQYSACRGKIIGYEQSRIFKDP
jgi:hypothetical protein